MRASQEATDLVGPKAVPRRLAAERRHDRTAVTAGSVEAFDQVRVDLDLENAVFGHDPVDLDRLLRVTARAQPHSTTLATE